MTTASTMAQLYSQIVPVVGDRRTRWKLLKKEAWKKLKLKRNKKGEMVLRELPEDQAKLLLDWLKQKRLLQLLAK